jgi:hypothetical protein
MSKAILDHVIHLTTSLSTDEKLGLILELVNQLQGKVSQVQKEEFPSLWGALKDLGPAPSAEEIDEARREAWASFPREEIAK